MSNLQSGSIVVDRTLLVEDSVKDSFRIGVSVGVDRLRQNGLGSFWSDDWNSGSNWIRTESGLGCCDRNGWSDGRNGLLLRSDDLGPMIEKVLSITGNLMRKFALVLEVLKTVFKFEITVLFTSFYGAPRLSLTKYSRNRFPRVSLTVSKIWQINRKFLSPRG